MAEDFVPEVRPSDGGAACSLDIFLISHFSPRKKAFHGYRFQGRERIFAFKWDGEVRGGRLMFEGEMQLRGGENSRLQRKSRTAGGAGGRDGADGAATLNLGVSFSASWLTPVGGETR